MQLTLPKKLIFAYLLVAATGAESVSLTRTTSFEYDAAGQLVKEITEPDNAQLRIENAYVLDGFGNRTKVTMSSTATGNAAVASRVTSATYDSAGRYQSTSTNSLLQSASFTTDAFLGQPTKVTDINNQVTNIVYDDFGRKIKETAPDGTSVVWSYTLCNGSCANNGQMTAYYYVEQKKLAADGITQIGAYTRKYFSFEHQLIRTETQGYDGSGSSTLIITQTQYDNLGRVTQETRPFYSGQTAYWTVSQYDVMSRLTKQTSPDASFTTYAYNGLTTSVTNTQSQTTSKTRNGRGQIISIKDANNQILQNQYDPNGNLSKTIDPNGNSVINTYDVLGRKLSMSDPDMGTWSYAYDGFGQLIKQTDANLQDTTYQYDAVGRMVKRSEPDLVATWTFDACTNGVGKLCQSGSDNGYTIIYVYDAFGRPTSSTTTTDTTYTVNNVFDAYGRVLSQTYPTGFAIKNTYTALGYLKQVSNNADGSLLWQANSFDAEGHLTQQLFGNATTTDASYDPKTGRIQKILAGIGSNVLNLSYGWDPVGNLTTRTDANLNVVETFLYDKLNRLTSTQGAGLPTIGYTYDALGNITSRSDIGTYSYNASRPHAVAGTMGTLNSSYTYDNNGNQVSGNDRSLTYSSYNLPTSITRLGKTDTFIYGPEHQRIKQVNPDGTIYYLNPDNAGGLLFEKEVKSANGVIESKHYINAAGQVVALYVSRSNGSNELLYWHKDNQGSVAAVTDTSGVVKERLSYEAFGKRRFPNGLQDPNNTIVGISTDRGYTGHEHLDDVELIHMNGRVYDPILGKFTSADPTVPNAEWLQDYNRYSYVTNNPFSYTDPTGYEEVAQVKNEANAQVVSKPAQKAGSSKQAVNEVNDSKKIADRSKPSSSWCEFCKEFKESWNGTIDALKQPWTFDRFVDGLQALPPVISGTTGALERLPSVVSRLPSGINIISKLKPQLVVQAEKVVAKDVPRVFWSGGDAAKNAAETWAKANGGTTLEMTSKGQELINLTKNMDWDKARPLWVQASREFAQGAKGEINVFQNANGISLQSVWREIEYPVLKGSSIIYHVVMPSGSAIPVK